MAWSDINVGDTWAVVRQKINDLGALSDSAIGSDDSPAQSIWNVGKDAIAAPISPAKAGASMAKVLARASLQIDGSGGGITIHDNFGFSQFVVISDGIASSEYLYCELPAGLVVDETNVMCFGSFWNNGGNNEGGRLYFDWNSAVSLRVKIALQNGSYNTQATYCSLALIGFGE